MAEKWTEAKDKADDKRRGIREGSARDVKLDKARGLPPDVARKGVGKGQAGPPMSGTPPITPPMGAMPPPAMPLPPGVKPPARKRRRPAPPPAPPVPAGPRTPMLPGAGGGNPVNLRAHSTTGPVKGGQRDRAGNNRPGVNAKGKKVGYGGGKGKGGKC